jgi:type I restriction enzyme S subunit
MASKWQTRRIGSIGRVVTGKTPSTKNSGFFGGAIPFITIPDMQDRVFISTSERSLTASGANAVRSSLLPKNAVMMSCIATIGRCGITTQPSVTNQQINSVICSEEVEPLYLYYTFRQLGHALETAGGGGSVYTNVSKSRFAELEIPLPPLSEQRAIAHILGTLDDKIELNRRMNQTLEAMARALFKSWFVDRPRAPARRSSCEGGREGPRPRPGPSQGSRRPLPRLVRGFTAGRNPEGVEGGERLPDC